MMGYDELWFESQPVSDEFKCPICKDVLQDPSTVSGCEHIFCSACIQQYFSTNSNQIDCPVCREPFNLSDLKPTLRAFRNLLDKLRVRCQLESCFEVVELQHFEKHQLDCEQNPINQQKPVQCPKLCGANIVSEDSADGKHDCVAFLQSRILSLTIDNSQQESDIKKLTSEVDKLREENLRLRTIESNVNMASVLGLNNEFTSLPLLP